MFINFWYAAAESKAVNDTPLHTRMLGQDFVVFRDDHGRLHCLSDICPHRGAALSEGKIKHNAVECPYHGWRFGGDGTCNAIPSLGPDACIPPRAHVDSYPVIERYGLVFVFLGDLDTDYRPGILNIDEYGKDDWRTTMMVLDWPLDYKRSIENMLDSAHIAHVHLPSAQSRKIEDFSAPQIDVESANWGATFTHTYRAPKANVGDFAKDKKLNDRMTMISGFYGPSQAWTSIQPTQDSVIHQYAFETPIDGETTRIYLFTARNFMRGEADDVRFHNRNVYVTEQDRLIVESIRTFQGSSDEDHECVVDADLPILQYRKYLHEWEAHGWRIDQAKSEGARPRVAFAIPSPARRTRTSWVIDAVPLISPMDNEKQAAE